MHIQQGRTVQYVFGGTGTPMTTLAEAELRRADGGLDFAPAPLVYRHAGYALLHGRPVLQLHWLIWFAARPPADGALYAGALDGVLFLDEAYALVATGAKNDFGLVAIDTLLARMENDRDRLVVIIAGYRADLDRFLDTNEGLRSRFTRSIDFPSYTSAELVEIANAMARQRDSVFEQRALDDLQRLFDHLAASSTPDAAGVARRSLDIAGNGRFVRNVVERSGEEREFRLDHLDAHNFTDEELMTITADDVANTVGPLLRGLGLQ